MRADQDEKKHLHAADASAPSASSANKKRPFASALSGRQSHATPRLRVTNGHAARTQSLREWRDPAYKAVGGRSALESSHDVTGSSHEADNPTALNGDSAYNGQSLRTMTLLF